MKKTIPKIGAILLAVTLCIIFSATFLSYIKPMENLTYNLSLMLGDGEEWTGDEKGWTVYTQEGETITRLTPNEWGIYSGLSFPGQTFYYSRTLEEDVDSPTLRIYVVHRNVVVYLDDIILYSDCPDMDNRIGYMTLPMREFDAAEPLTLKLPQNYKGKTLTIAQSTETVSDSSTTRLGVYPCDVYLSCGYAYESELIAESFQTAILMTISFVIGLFLLVMFVHHILQGETDFWLVCMALTAFFWMTMQVTNTSYHYSYFGMQDFSITQVCHYLIVISLLAFLSSRAGKYKQILWGLTGIMVLTVFLYYYAALYNAFGVLTHLPEITGFIGLLTAIIMGLLFWRKENYFYRFFSPLTGTGIMLYFIYVLFSSHREKILLQLKISIESLAPDYFLWQLGILVTIVTFGVAMKEYIERELNRYTEKRLLKTQYEMVQKSYDNLRQHNEQVLMLRHDMNKHLTMLRHMSDIQQINGYLDEVISENNQIRPIIQSGNEILDIILNGKLSSAEDSGVKLDIIRTEAPEKLPLSDSDFCSLIMNIMDNAIAAATEIGVTNPYIRLDIHMKNDFFVFSCENSMNDRNEKERAKKHTPTETVQLHGLGLKIIQQISARYDILLNTEYDKACYKLTLAIPMNQASR